AELEADGSLVPFSADLELRPRGAAPVDGRRLLRDRLEAYLSDVDDALHQLRRVAEEARQANNPVVEAQIRSRLAELGIKLVALGKDSGPPPGRAISQDTLIDWATVPPRAQEKFKEAFEVLEMELGGPDAARAFWERREAPR